MILPFLVKPMGGILSDPVKKTNRSFKLASVSEPRTLPSFSVVACVASVSVLFRSKERPRNEILGFDRARNETRGKKMKERGGGGEGRKRLQTNPSVLKTCVRQRTQCLIGSAT